MQRILVADDDVSLRRLLVKALKKAGFQVLEAENGSAALALHRAEPADLLVLDLNMPVMDGFQVLKALRPRDEVPVLMLTAMGQEQKRVEGFKFGADDYVLKPFSAQELVARIRAILRRSYRFSELKPLRTGPFLLDRMSKQLTRNDAPVDLSPMEYHVLEVLLSHAGRLLPRLDLLDLAWPSDARPSPRTVDVTIVRLRRKITLPGDPKWITSSGSLGFCWTGAIQEVEPQTPRKAGDA
ncbi:DNA-binding response regulator [Geothrix limicola]|uniref:DNA-binding response regulator n=1 Tax=Geothrix limicola TaxID=2927978 RepID=A0ABQ5QK87_9BACT|nr:response regulator transcription factor [Geothrix limicola]GLH74713.1 DNA-binding response regulator [Geothrix limicola]